MSSSPDLTALWQSINRGEGDADVLAHLTAIRRRFETDFASAMESEDATDRLLADSEELEAVITELRARGRVALIEDFERQFAPEEPPVLTSFTVDVRARPVREEEFHDMVRGPCSCGAWH